jgi:hypothetical protein
MCPFTIISQAPGPGLNLQFAYIYIIRTHICFYLVSPYNWSCHTRSSYLLRIMYHKWEESKETNGCKTKNTLLYKFYLLSLVIIILLWNWALAKWWSMFFLSSLMVTEWTKVDAMTPLVDCCSQMLLMFIS